MAHGVLRPPRKAMMPLAGVGANQMGSPNVQDSMPDTASITSAQAPSQGQSVPESSTSERISLASASVVPFAPMPDSQSLSTGILPDVEIVPPTAVPSVDTASSTDPPLSPPALEVRLPAISSDQQSSRAAAGTFPSANGILHDDSLPTSNGLTTGGKKAEVDLDDGDRPGTISASEADRLTAIFRPDSSAAWKAQLRSAHDREQRRGVAIGDVDAELGSVTLGEAIDEDGESDTGKAKADGKGESIAGLENRVWKARKTLRRYTILTCSSTPLLLC